MEAGEDEEEVLVEQKQELGELRLQEVVVEEEEKVPAAAAAAVVLAIVSFF